ncbi:metallopeptidase-like protein [Fusarium avenaceum]|nr:metallopeptidase-like protein [Fusarium avenaceum]
MKGEAVTLISPFSISPQCRRIDPTKPRTALLKPDGSDNNNDRVDIGTTPLAFNTTNMQLWSAHNPARACFVAASGYVVLWDFHGCDHLSAHLPLINEVRSGASFFYYETGPRTQEHAARFAASVDELLLEVCDGQVVTEHARMIKGPDEIRAVRCAVASCEAAVGEMRQAMRAGATENDVWAALHSGNIRRGGEWIETRILCSGPQTNPWLQESGPRILSDGDLVCFDTDLIGVYGICVDMSRSWICGDLEPTAEQKHLYRIAYEHITTNIEMIKPGVRFTELTHNSHRLPERYRAQRYCVLFHGVGLCDEYPCIRYPEDLESYGYEGELFAGMVLSVEAYVGEVGGKDGIKLENQLLVTETGYELLTKYPFEVKNIMMG